MGSHQNHKIRMVIVDENNHTHYAKYICDTCGGKFISWAKRKTFIEYKKAEYLNKHRDAWSIDLNISSREIDIVKSKGAKYDEISKCWYAAIQNFSDESLFEYVDKKSLNRWYEKYFKTYNPDFDYEKEYTLATEYDVVAYAVLGDEYTSDWRTLRPSLQQYK